MGLMQWLRDHVLIHVRTPPVTSSDFQMLARQDAEDRLIEAARRRIAQLNDDVEHLADPRPQR